MKKIKKPRALVQASRDTDGMIEGWLGQWVVIYGGDGRK